MTEPNPIFNFLMDMVGRLPVFTIWMVGIVIAIARWRRHPRSSLSMIIGLVLFIMGALVFGLIHHLLLDRLMMNGASPETIQRTLIPLQLTAAVVHVAGWILVLLAAFGAAAAPSAVESEVSSQHSSGLAGEQIEALKRIVPVSSPFYIGVVVITFGLGLVLSVVSSTFTFLSDQPEIGGGVACFSMIPIVAGMIAMCVFIHRIWAAIQMGQPRTTPGKAVGFLFIPFFSFYWVFQAYWGWAKDYNRLIVDLDVDAPKMPEKQTLAFCIFMVVAWPIEFIPFVGPLVAVVGVVLLVLFVAKASDAVQALIDAGQRTTAENKQGL